MVDDSWLSIRRVESTVIEPVEFKEDSIATVEEITMTEVIRR